MPTGEAIAELFAGLLGAGFGVLLMYQGTRPKIHRWLRTWWTKYLEEPEAMDKIMCWVAGIGFFLVGVGLLIQSIRELLQ
jgi:membrane protein DedA with SNARE-associated domain